MNMRGSFQTSSPACNRIHENDLEPTTNTSKKVWMTGAAVLILLLCGGGMMTFSHRSSVGQFENISYGSAVTVATKYPYVVDIQVTSSSGSKQCTGVIMTPKWVLTAKKCTAESTAIKIFAGSATRSPRASTTQERASIKVATNGGHALVELDKALVFGPSVTSITISPNAPGMFKATTAVGWGQSQNGQVSKLQEVAAETQPKFCSAYEHAICTQQDGGACGGDEGSPLLWEQNGITAVVGILLRSSSPCSTKGGHTDVYESSTWLREWIRVTTLAKIVHVDSTSKSCRDACGGIGRQALSTGIRSKDGRKYDLCAVNHWNSGFRGGVNVHGDSPQCWFAAGNREYSSSTFRCFCADGAAAYESISESSNSCEVECSKGNLKPLRTGDYGSKKDAMYACAVNVDGTGYRSGFNLMVSGYENKCLVSKGGKRIDSTAFLCICAL